MTAQLKAETGILNGGPDLLLARAGEAVAAAERVLIAAKTGVRAKVAEAGGIDAAQHAAHGLAWLATTVGGAAPDARLGEPVSRARAASASSSSCCSPPASPSTCRRSPAASR